MPLKIIPPEASDVTLYMRKLFIRTEQAIINEITRKRAKGYVDYAEVAALERVQRILQNMTDESWIYVPEMIEKIFYKSEKDAAGYANARILTAAQTDVIQILANNFLGDVSEAADTAYKTVQNVFTVARLEQDPFRESALKQVLRQEASGIGWSKTSAEMIAELQNKGITAFEDKAGRKWSLTSYGNMAVRTTARQAEVAAILTADDWDLWEIVKIGSTCPVCAPLEGRIYSKSGTDPNYPPLSLAFGKIDPNGPDDLTNTYLNIHPNCLVPGGSILCEGLVSASRRHYTGNVIHLITAGGNEITVTPNHPILTTKGFVAAGSLKEGDEIIEATRKYRAFLRKAPNSIDVPTGIEEIFHSIVKASNGTAFSVKGSPVQFHSDGIANRKVDIIFSASFGINEGDILCRKPVGKEKFPSAHFRRPSLFANSTATKVIVSAFHAFYSFMCGFGLINCIKAITINGKKLSDLRHGTATSFSNLRIGHSLIVKLKKMLELLSVGFKKSRRNITKFFSSLTLRKYNSKLFFSIFKSSDRNIEIPRNLGTGDAFTVKSLKELFSNNCLVISKLTHKETSFYDGYVYNLETKPHYYIYNNIVTHNCLHSLVKYTTIGKTEKQIQRDIDFSSPEKNPLDRDPRTKKQIEAYRTKEKNRRQLISDIRQHREYRAALGSEVPKDFDSFRELKYNNPDKWRTLQKTKRIYTEIDKKNWTDEFKLKSKQSFKRFKDNGIIMSSHALSRLTRLNAEGLPVITESDLIDFINNSKPKYKEGTRDIYISKEKVLTVVQNSENKDIISIVRRSKIKNGWSEIIR